MKESTPANLKLTLAVVSHSPNLTSLPTTLATLPHLAKLTLSHCAKLSASGLPDLSALPLLRDVRANNLPRLTTIPSHLATWGTGNLSLAGKESKDGAERKGSGLEVLDLGNCSLPLSSISELFALSLPPGAKPKHTWQLRSITLQANPLTLEDETYADALQRSPALPRLQIIDSKRVVERKNAGAQPESKAERKARERQERKMGPTGANADAGGKKEMRAWGGEEAREKGEKFGNADKGGKKRPREERERRGKEGKPRFADKERTRPPRDVKDKASAAVPKRKRDADAEPPAKKRKEKESFFVDVDGDKPPPAAKPKAASAPKQTPTPAPKATATEAAEADRPAKKRKRKHGKSGAEEPETSAPARATTPAKAAQAPKAEAPRQAGRPEKKKLTKSETAVVGVVEVARPKAGGIDLKSVVAKESASGLDVGGW